MSRPENPEEWVFEDLAAITGRDIREIKKAKSKPRGSQGNRHKYFRRPGKRHNNDFCYSCNEGGTLICCDGCPKSFHLICLYPSMEEDDIPEGQWLCVGCRYARDNEIKDKAASITEDSKGKDNGSETQSKSAAMVIKEFWKELIKIAETSDPKEYKNPLDCRTVPYNFPGESKGSRAKKRITPHSVKCYVCNKGPGKQPMINCDYCENSYHLDCADPPLTFPPKYYWMCQYHIEPYLESFLFKDGTPSLSQRIALWDLCREPIDHEIVKLEFLRNAAKSKPYYDISFKLPTVPIEVPDAVIQQYLSPVDKLPSLADALKVVSYSQTVDYLKNITRLVRSSSLETVRSFSKPGDETASTDLAASEEEEVWLSSVIEFQKEYIKWHLSNLKVDSPQAEDVVKEEDPIVAPPTASDSEEYTESVAGSQESGKKRKKVSSKKDEVESKKARSFSHRELTNILREFINSQPDSKDSLKMVETLDKDVSKLLCFQRLCQMKNMENTFNKSLAGHLLLDRSSAVEDKSYGKKCNPVGSDKRLSEDERQESESSPANPLLMLAESAEKMNEFLYLNVGDSYCKVDKKNFEEYLNEELAENSSDKCSSGSAVRTDSESGSSRLGIGSTNPIGTAENPQIVSDEIKEEPSEEPTKEVDLKPVPGVLATFEGHLQIFPVKKSNFIIGRGSNSDLDLDRCGFCYFISTHHATIFYDSLGKCWELINYSIHGTRVDNMVLHLDSPKSAVERESSNSKLLQELKTVVKSHAANSEEKKQSDEREHFLENFHQKPCGCDPNSYLELPHSGWGNSVPFQHGSVLQFGCIKLIFGDVQAVTGNSE